MAVAKEFDLEDILTITTGIGISSNPQALYEVVDFMMGGDRAGLPGKMAAWACETAIFEQHPELKNVDSKALERSLDAAPDLEARAKAVNGWAEEQKKIYGNTLKISPLEDEPTALRRNRIMSAVQRTMRETQKAQYN